MSEFSSKSNLTPGQPRRRSGGGCRRALIFALAAVLVIALVGALFVFVGLPAIACPKAGAGAPAGAVSEFCFTPFTGGSHAIGGIAAGPDGNLWFTEGSRIGRMTPQGAITEFTRPTSDTSPGAIVAGPDGNLWFIEQTAKALGRITPQGVVTQFALPPGDTSPVGLAAGPDGALWYTRSPNNPNIGGPPNTGAPGIIGRMTVNGTATEFTPPTPPAPRPPAQPRDIVAGPDGALWFDTGSVNGVNNGDSWIGRITTTGQASIVYLPDASALTSIVSLATGPDRNLWFTAMSDTINTNAGGPPQTSSNVGRLTPSGAVTLLTLSGAPGNIIAGADGNLWVALSTGAFGRITPAGQVTAFKLPDQNAQIGPLAGRWARTRGVVHGNLRRYRPAQRLGLGRQDWAHRGLAAQTKVPAAVFVLATQP